MSHDTAAVVDAACSASFDQPWKPAPVVYTAFGYSSGQNSVVIEFVCNVFHMTVGHRQES